MGRPTDLTDAITLKICEVLEEGNSIADACALAGIDESTYHRWVNRGEAGEEPFREFCELTRAARAQGRQKHVQAIESARGEDWRASAWFLERSDPANWGRKDKLQADVTSGGEPIQTIFYMPENGRDRDATTGNPPAAGSPDDLSE